MKKGIQVILSPIIFILKGFEYLASTISKGFFFYFVKFSELLKKITKKKCFDKWIRHFKERQKEPEFILISLVYVEVFICLFNLFYQSNTPVVSLSKEPEMISEKKVKEKKQKESQNTLADSLVKTIDNNQYRQFEKYSIYDVHITDLKNQNSDTIAYISVDGTKINYPVVQTVDNDYYLNHSFDKSYRNTGWIFLDYRNSLLEDSNTIFYGHNLLNKTAFGSISNIFTDNWFQKSSHIIKIKLENDQIYTYQIFSTYYSDPNVYYLQTNFSTTTEYETFLKNIKEKSNRDYGLELNATDKIITLSTCTEDNQGRKVVHAKLMNIS